MENEIQKNVDKLKDSEFTQGEKALINECLEDLRKDPGYQVLKRKFYNELENIELHILMIQDKDLGMNVQNKEEIIEEFKKQKQELIDACGFIFDYKE